MTMPEEFNQLSLDGGKTHPRDFVSAEGMLSKCQSMEEAYKAGAIAALHAAGFRMAELYYDKVTDESVDEKIREAMTTVQSQVIHS